MTLHQDAPLDALAAVLKALPALPERALFLRGRDGAALSGFERGGWLYEQNFRPMAEAIEHGGGRVGSALPGERFPLVLLLPPRQRDEARALYARATDSVCDDGMIIASIANNDGARSSQDDLEQLCDAVDSVSKHKCRVLRVERAHATIDAAVRERWLAADAIQPIAAGRFVSRPGLFAWDRIDNASALLAANLPASLSGRVADLGAGSGFLSHHVLTHCPGVTAIDLYEADARALEPARMNLDGVRTDVDRAFLWHDVTRGLPHRYDAIVSNPPFHQQGRADQPDVGRAFIRAAADALEAHGQLWLVANRHLPYEATLAARFGQVREVARQQGFKVFHASEPTT